MKKVGFLLIISAVFLINNIIYAASAGDVVINEIAWMGTEASSGHEWIELYNTTGNDIDLTNWCIEDSGGVGDRLWQHKEVRLLKDESIEIVTRSCGIVL